MLGCVRIAPGGIYVRIHAVPGSKKTSFSYDEFTKSLRIKISAPALDGKANKELLSLLADLLGDIELHSGSKSREKLILVRGANTESVSAILENVLRD
jgi:uncharacterized protein (TIGR00251 family)